MRTDEQIDEKTEKLAKWLDWNFGGPQIGNRVRELAARVAAAEARAEQAEAAVARVQAERDKHFLDPDDPSECDDCGHPWWPKRGGCIVRQKLYAALAVPADNDRSGR